jgi:ABC-2 type transport system permease protein
VVLLFLFAYAVSLDVSDVRIGVVQEAPSASAQELAAAFAGTRYLDVTFAHDRREVAKQVVSGKLRGFVVIPQDLERRLAARDGQPLVQVIADGSQPNTANYVANYTQGVVKTWRAGLGAETASTAVILEPRYWFNAELESRRSLVPGAIAIVMTIIGTMLTALVVAREWERGTMEAVLSTPASVAEILIGKLLPYFALGMLSTLAATALAVFVFDVPMRGSLAALLLLSAVFMVPALGQGLLISSVTRNQFLAAQIALFSGFLPAFMLSGFLYEIDAMPAPIRAITWLIPARYFVSSLKTVFLAGDIWAVFVPNLLAMATIGMLFFLVAKRATRKNLE